MKIPINIKDKEKNLVETLNDNFKNKPEVNTDLIVGFDPADGEDKTVKSVNKVYRDPKTGRFCTKTLKSTIENNPNIERLKNRINEELQKTINESLLSSDKSGKMVEEPKSNLDFKSTMQNALREETTNIDNKSYYLNTCQKSKPNTDKYEMVNHPSHYNHSSIETIEKMRRIWGNEKTALWCEMTAFKYRDRIGYKPDNSNEQEVAKIKWYENKAKELKNM